MGLCTIKLVSINSYIKGVTAFENISFTQKNKYDYVRGRVRKDKALVRALIVDRGTGERTTGSFIMDFIMVMY